MKFPQMILDLLDCPGLLRLRDVRMANNQFFAFPAFANSSRYEHSLGVCYLAGICADHIGLDERAKYELMLAGLYHDVGTPPFAHAMEEVLQARFGFDHELNLKKLIMGDTGEFDQDFAQIYLGQSLKLKSICQGKRARKIGIDPHRIANIVVGDKSEELASLINGSFMDLDNIDNICRAVSAMGILGHGVNFGDLAVKLAKSFVLRNGKVLYNSNCFDDINQWVNMRDVQYSEIYRSVDDFSYQAMIKKAIRLFFEKKDGLLVSPKDLWKNTDSEFTQLYLLQHKDSKQLMERVLLCRPYSCLILLYVRGKGVNKYINEHIRSMEKDVSNYLSSDMGLTRYGDNDLVLANFYPDKRHRWINDDRWTEPESIQIKNPIIEEGAILGFFTPSKVVGYADDKNGDGRSIHRFDKSKIPALKELIQGFLPGFEVMENGKEY